MQKKRRRVRRRIRGGDRGTDGQAGGQKGRVRKGGGGVDKKTGEGMASGG